MCFVWCLYLDYKWVRVLVDFSCGWFCFVSCDCGCKFYIVSNYLVWFFEVVLKFVMFVDCEFKFGRFVCGVVCNFYGDVKGCVLIFFINGIIVVNCGNYNIMYFECNIFC